MSFAQCLSQYKLALLFKTELVEYRCCVAPHRVFGGFQKRFCPRFGETRTIVCRMEVDYAIWLINGETYLSWDSAGHFSIRHTTCTHHLIRCRWFGLFIPAQEHPTSKPLARSSTAFILNRGFDAAQALCPGCYDSG
jgi:hypothetical protein